MTENIVIDPLYHDHIFTLFENLNPSVHCTGMGPVIARRIIEVHGRKICAEVTKVRGFFYQQ